MKTLKLFMAAMIVAVVALAVTATTFAFVDSSTCQITTITNDDVAR